MADDRPAEARLYLEQDMDAPDSIDLAGSAAIVFSARCPEKQSPNEDAAALIPCGSQAAVLVVADGLGGPRAGEHAAGRAVRAMETSILAGLAEGQMLRTAILNGFENANRAVLELGVGAATTLAVVELQDGTARPYHAGDSTILVVGQRGKIKHQTTSHSPVGFAVQAGFLDEQQAMHHEDRHLVSNVIGSPEMRIEIGPTLRLSPRDTVLLASDGLLDNLHIEEIAERIRKGRLVDAAARVAEEAARRMREPKEGCPSKPDDLTLIAFRLRWP